MAIAHAPTIQPAADNICPSAFVTARLRRCDGRFSSSSIPSLVPCACLHHCRLLPMNAGRCECGPTHRRHAQGTPTVATPTHALAIVAPVRCCAPVTRTGHLCQRFRRDPAANDRNLILAAGACALPFVSAGTALGTSHCSGASPVTALGQSLPSRRVRSQALPAARWCSPTDRWAETTVSIPAAVSPRTDASLRMRAVMRRASSYQSCIKTTLRPTTPSSAIRSHSASHGSPV